MWGEQKLLKQRDELVQKLWTIRPTPTAEIDELRHCNSNELKRLIGEIQRLYDKFFAPISTKSQTIATLTKQRDSLQVQCDENKRQQELILLEIKNLTEGTREYAEMVRKLETLIDDGESLPAQIAEDDETIGAELAAKTVLETLLRKERNKRIATTESDVEKLDKAIVKSKIDNEKRKATKSDLEDMRDIAIRVDRTKSSTSKAEALIAKSLRAKQTAPVATPKKAQVMHRTTEAQINPLPLTEEE